MQQGGNPTPNDRIMAARMASEAVKFVERACNNSHDEPPAVCLGMMEDQIKYTPLYEIPRVYDMEHQRSKHQWWMDLRPVVRALAQPGPQFHERSGHSAVE